MNSFTRSLRRDRSGGIEGLPLQLMIIILVATMGSAVIIGWMGNIETPHMISDVSVDSGHYNAVTEIDSNTGTISNVKIMVYDQDGNPLEDATVVLNGLGVKSVNTVNTGTTDAPVMEKVEGTAVMNTNESGVAEFETLNVNLHGNTGMLHVDVSKSGYGQNNSATIVVVKTCPTSQGTSENTSQ